MKKKMKIILLAFLLVLSLEGCKKKKEEEKPEETVLEKEFVYESESERGTEGIPSTITVDGKTYELIDLSDAVFSTLEARDIVEVIREVILADMSELEEQYELDIEGKRHTLDLYEKYLEQKEVEITRRATVSYPKITGTLSADDIPHSIEIPVFRDGQEQNMDAELLQINKITQERWIGDLQIDGVFEGSALTEYFLLPNGEELWIESEKPLWEGFSRDILSNRGLPLKYYELTDGKWIDKYHQKGDLWQRNALYTGRRLAADYEAVYELTYKTLGYSGKVIYRKVVSKEEVPAEKRRIVYTIKALVRYRLLGED